MDDHVLGYCAVLALVRVGCVDAHDKRSRLVVLSDGGSVDESREDWRVVVLVADRHWQSSDGVLRWTAEVRARDTQFISRRYLAVQRLQRQHLAPKYTETFIKRNWAGM